MLYTFVEAMKLHYFISHEATLFNIASENYIDHDSLKLDLQSRPIAPPPPQTNTLASFHSHEAQRMTESVWLCSQVSNYLNVCVCIF